MSKLSGKFSILATMAIASLSVLVHALPWLILGGLAVWFLIRSGII